jgi:hypothetical protein
MGGKAVTKHHDRARVGVFILFVFRSFLGRLVLFLFLFVGADGG